MKRLKRLISRENRIIKRALDRHAKRVAHRHRKERGLLKRKLRHERRVFALRKRSLGFMWVDGYRVCGWIAAELATARAYGWKGRVISGYRTPWYSEQLCYARCGRPSCVGTCAGRNTNHARGPAYPLGAVDVNDQYTLEAICVRHGLRIHNSLSNDKPHFSHSGA